MISRIREWARRRTARRQAAYERALQHYRDRFPGEPEILIRALAAGGDVAACAIRAIVESREIQARDERIRRIMREELDAWRMRARNSAGAK